MCYHNQKRSASLNPFTLQFRMISLSLILLAMILMQSTLTAEDNQINAATKSEINRLESIWKSWDKSVTSLELKGFRFVKVFGQTNQAFSHADFDKLIRDKLIPIVKNDNITPNNLQKNLDEASPTGGYWRPFTFITAKDATRLDDTIEGKTFTTVRIGGQEFSYFETSRQANVYGTFTGLTSLRVSDYIYRPSHSFTSGKWNFSCNDNKTCQLKSNSTFIEYDKQSGMIKHVQVRSRNNNFVRERIQANEIVSPDGIPIPRLIAEANYSRGESSVRLLDLCILSQVTVNPKINPEQFHLAVPAGINVVKFKTGGNHIPASQGGTRPPMRRTTAPISDLRSFAQQF